MGGQVAMWNPAAAGGYYPMPPYAYYAHPMQPGSPMAGGGQDGMGTGAGVPYAAMPYAAYHTMPPPGAAAAMGGFPGGPAAAAAMAAMSAPVPLQIPLSPRGAGAQVRRASAKGLAAGNGGGVLLPCTLCGLACTSSCPWNLFREVATGYLCAQLDTLGPASV